MTYHGVSTATCSPFTDTAHRSSEFAVANSNAYRLRSHQVIPAFIGVCNEMIWNVYTEAVWHEKPEAQTWWDGSHRWKRVFDQVQFCFCALISNLSKFILNLYRNHRSWRHTGVWSKREILSSQANGSISVNKELSFYVGDASGPMAHPGVDTRVSIIPLA